MTTYTTRDGDMLDEICFRHYGTATGIEEQVLDANPGLADQGPVFASGINITLPEIEAAAGKEVIRLWD